MCVVSNIGDQYGRTFPDRWPTVITPQPNTIPGTSTFVFNPITRDEFEALKSEVEQLRLDLLAAKAQDIAEGNADCEMEEKIAFLRQVAEFVGVSLEDVFPE